MLFDPDEDMDFSPEAVAREFANEIIRYLNEAGDAPEADQRKVVILEGIRLALAAYVYEPDSQLITKLNPLGSLPDDEVIN